MKIQAIYICRHGETEWALCGKHTGHTDISLTKKGEQQAKKLRKRLKGTHFDYVFTSPLKRAFDTCLLAGFSEQAIVNNDLVEWDYGDYEGKTTKEICTTKPNFSIFTSNPPGGETIAQVSDRADRFFSTVSRLEGTIAVFSSGHISRVLGARWLGLPASYGQYLALSTGSVSILGFEHNKPVIQLWNETSYL